MAWWTIENIEEHGKSCVTLVTDRQNNILFDITFSNTNNGMIRMHKTGRPVEHIRVNSMKDLLERTKLIFQRPEQLRMQMEILKRI